MNKQELDNLNQQQLLVDKLDLETSRLNFKNRNITAKRVNFELAGLKDNQVACGEPLVYHTTALTALIWEKKHLMQSSGQASLFDALDLKKSQTADVSTENNKKKKSHLKSRFIKHNNSLKVKKNSLINKYQHSNLSGEELDVEAEAESGSIKSK